MSESEISSNKIEDDELRKKIQERIGKRLAYLLRYGAQKEGLNVYDGGFIKLNELLETSLLKYNNQELIINELKTSLSHRNVNRFEFKTINKELCVRATYGRKFERAPFHLNSKVNRLLEICLTYIVNNIKNYDFEGFPDEFLINEILHRLKRAKKLNSKIVESMLSNNLEHLDFDGIFLTEKILKTVYKKCKNLKILSLKDCGYFLNDHFLELILKNCRQIESIDLSYCKDLTDKSLFNICKYIPNVVHLVICGNSNYTENAVLEIVRQCLNLRRLDIFDSNITEDGMNMIVAIALSRPEQQSLKVIHKYFNDTILSPEKPWFS